MAFGNNTIDFNALGITPPSTTIIQPSSINELTGDTDYPAQFVMTDMDETTPTQEQEVVSDDLAPQEEATEEELPVETDNSDDSEVGVGNAGMTQADEEQLADKADETHVSGGNESMGGMLANAQNNTALIGVLLVGASYGAYKYENETSFFSKNYKKLMNTIKRYKGKIDIL
jgi:hypothetical protein